MNGAFLVTGGEGFIGRNILSMLRDAGEEAYSLDIVAKPDYKVSVTDREGLNDINRRFECIFHLAATTSPPQFEEDPAGGLDVNVTGTYNILDYARKHGVSSVVIASSSAIYGDRREASIEKDYQDRHLNLYPVTKIIDELLCRHFSARNELRCISLRYFNTFGTGENTKGAYSSPISKFLDSAKQSKDIEVFGDGTQSRDFIYVKDTASASIAAFKKGRAGEAYNVGTGLSTSFTDIAKIIKSLTNSKSQIRYVPNPFKNYQMYTKADMTKTRRELDFKPRYDLHSAILEMQEIDETIK